jgi:hypothetical protein
VITRETQVIVVAFRDFLIEWSNGTPVFLVFEPFVLYLKTLIWYELHKLESRIPENAESRRDFPVRAADYGDSH